jgi:hypothetical protein
MSVVVLVNSPWTRRLAAGLVAAGAPVTAVAYDLPDAPSTAPRQPVAGVPTLTASTVDTAGSEPPTAVLCAHDARVPHWLTLRFGDLRRIRFEISHPGIVVADDPVWWMVRNRIRAGSLRILGNCNDNGNGAEQPFTLAPLDTYAQALDVVAGSLAQTLKRIALGPGDGAAGQHPTDPIVGRAVLPHRPAYLDWSAPAEDVVAAVRAAPATDPARTYLAGSEVTVARARVNPADHCNVTPGTVVAHDDGWVVARAGTGLVAVTDLRDLVGPLRPDLLPVGTLLGVDASAELAQLRARIVDLEYAVAWLADATGRRSGDIRARGPRR